MRSEEARQLLMEYAEGTLPPAEHAQVEAAINADPQLQSDLSAIGELRMMANNWHDEVPRAWSIPTLDRPSHLEQFANGFRQWFPTFASSAALVLVAVMYFEPPTQTGNGLPAQQMTDYSSLPELPQATQAAFDSALESNRQQRQQELQSLLEILTAEMNRRSIETEESMRYLVTSQIEGQQELDSLYKQLQELLAAENELVNGTENNNNLEGVSQ